MNKKTTELEVKTEALEKFAAGLDPKTLEKALRYALAREAIRMKKAAGKLLEQSEPPVRHAREIAKTIRAAAMKKPKLGVYVSATPAGKKGKGLHTNSLGKKYPIAMWLNSGSRTGLTRESAKTNGKRYTGKIEGRGFIEKMEAQELTKSKEEVNKAFFKKIDQLKKKLES